MPRDPVPVLLVAVVLAGALSGCTDAPAAADDRPVLADFAQCNLTYPDGKPVDCDTDAPSARNSLTWPLPLATWACVDEIGSLPGTGARLWTDGQGAYAVQSARRGANETVYRFWLEDQVLLLREDLTEGALVPFPETIDPGRSVDWGFTSWVMSGSLVTPSANASLAARTSTWQGQPWFVWVFEMEERSYFFQSMGSVDGRPTPLAMSVDGADFSLNVTAGALDGESSYTPPPVPAAGQAVPGRCSA